MTQFTLHIIKFNLGLSTLAKPFFILLCHYYIKNFRIYNLTNFVVLNLFIYLIFYDGSSLDDAFKIFKMHTPCVINKKTNKIYRTIIIMAI